MAVLYLQERKKQKTFVYPVEAIIQEKDYLEKRKPLLGVVD